MSGIFWMGGMTALSGGMNDIPRSSSKHQDIGAREQNRELEHQIGRLLLFNQALWELLRDRLDVTDADLESKIHEVDIRDGVEDGELTTTALKCPTCGRISSSKHWKCL